jgi:hypothetical protein
MGGQAAMQTTKFSTFRRIVNPFSLRPSTSNDAAGGLLCDHAGFSG